LSGTRAGKYQYYICSLYHNAQHHYKRQCSRHGVRRDVIEEIVLNKIKEAWNYARENREVFAEKVRNLSAKDSAKTIKSKTSELNKAERRVAELDRIIKRIYEDHIAEKLSDERFSKMLSDYETEQTELSSGADIIRADLAELQSKVANVNSFLEIVDRYTEISELTAEIARTFVNKVLVHEPVLVERKNGHKMRTQEIEVVLNGIGIFSTEQ
jgi:polyhydroxyalkanoate synthesis regulator phasin